MMEKSAQPVVRVGSARLPFSHSQYLSTITYRTTLWYTLQLRGQINFPYFYSTCTPICNLWLEPPKCCLCFPKKITQFLCISGALHDLQNRIRKVDAISASFDIISKNNVLHLLRFRTWIYSSLCIQV